CPCAHRSTSPRTAGQRPRHRQRPRAEDPLRRQRQKRGSVPPRSGGSAARRTAGNHSRPEAGRAGGRQRPATGSAGHHWGAETGGHAGPKSEIRNTKFETNSNVEIPMIKTFGFSFRVLWSFGLVSDFDIRI